MGKQPIDFDEVKRTWAGNWNNSLKFKHIINTIKLFHGCFLCGYDQHARSLDFHHLDPSKKEMAISQFMSIARISEEDLLEEIGKCVVLCANCHRMIHDFVYYEPQKKYKMVQTDW